MKYFFKILLRVFSGLLGFLLLLFLILIISIQIPAVQQKIKNETVQFLENKTGTTVQIGHISLSLSGKVKLKEVYIEDLQNDTLLSSKSLKVNIAFLELLNKNISLESIDIGGLSSNIKRNSDSEFNFDFLIDAFTPDTISPKDTSATAFNFEIKKMNLSDIQFAWDDAITNTNVKLHLGHFNTRFQIFDLNEMIFDVATLSISDFTTSVYRGEIAHLVEIIEEKSLEKSAALPIVRVDKIQLNNIYMDYKDDVLGLETALNLNDLAIKVNAIDLEKEQFDVKDLMINGLQGKVQLNPKEKSTVLEEATNLVEASSISNLLVQVQNIDLHNIDIDFKNLNEAPLANGFDYNYININDFNLKANNVSYSAEASKGEIHDLRFKEQKGFDLQAFSTQFYFSDKGAFLHDLVIQTPHTQIANQTDLKYASLDVFANELEQLDIKTDFKNSKIGMQDVLFFVPQIQNEEYIKPLKNVIINIDGVANGTLNNLAFQNIKISVLEKTNLHLSGNIKGLPDAEQAFYNIQLKKFETTKNEILKLTPTGLIPENISLPNQLSLKGNFDGKIEDFKTNLNLQSDFGQLIANGSLNMKKQDQEVFDFNFSIKDFKLGELLQNDSLGNISLHAEAKGVGFNPKTANATIEGAIDYVEFNHYLYENLILEGNIEDGSFNLNTFMDDENIDFSFQSNGTFKGDYPSFKMEGNVKNIALHKLNLYDSLLVFSGKIDADFSTADLDFLNGEIILKQFLMATESQTIPLQNIVINSTATENEKEIVVNAPFLTANVKGNFQLTQIVTSLMNSVDKYYGFLEEKMEAEALEEAAAPQFFELNMSIQNDELIQMFLPELDLVNPILIQANYKEENDYLALTINAENASYQNFNIHNVIFNANTTDDNLVYDLNIKSIDGGDIQIPQISLSGNLNKELLTFDLNLKDVSEKNQYRIGGDLAFSPDSLLLTFNHENLLLNYQKWNLSEDNAITIGDEGVKINNIYLSRKNSVIHTFSTENSFESPIELQFINFDIATISEMVSSDELLVGGIINGNVSVADLKNSPKLNGDFNIARLSYVSDTIGDLKIEVNNTQQNSIFSKVVLTGFGNNLQLIGNYFIEDKGLDYELNIERIELKSVERFAAEYISNTKGFLTGNFKVKGTVEEPIPNGSLKFNDVGFRVDMLNGYFQNMNDEIVLDKNGVYIDKFLISDINKNTLSLSGNVLTNNYQDFNLNLNLKANNFKALNSTARDNNLYYGDLYFNSNIQVRGTLDNPVVRGTLAINEKTKVTLIIPQEDPSIVEREGIVEFVDEVSLQEKKMDEFKEEFTTSELAGMDISVNLTIDPNAFFKVVVDESSGDNLQLKGNAQLNFGIDKSGMISLTGRYEFTEGIYELSFNLIRKKFQIEPGSNIVWSGNPTAANVNITAFYESQTAPIDLLESQLVGVTGPARNIYMQRLPFQTLLKVEGELLQPEISFDIRLPDRNFTVPSEVITNTRAKLAQIREEPTELNKQVFALLILNRFIGDNPFASEAGGANPETIARQSASKILTQQLNNLSSSLIKGIDIEFDLVSQDDFSTGEQETRTDLSVGLSKQFFNNRLKVSIGSTFELEGADNDNQNASNIAGDILIDYMLSKDGRFRLQAFRQNEYEVALQGQVVETGVSFIITTDYDTFKEIFKRKENRNRRKKSKNEN